MQISTTSSDALQSLLQTTPDTNRPERSSASLTEFQTELIASTLAQYDSQNLTQEDAEAIVNTFSEAGIAPSKALEEAMNTAGFDAREVGDMARTEGSQLSGAMPPPPPPPSQSSSDDTLLELLTSLNEDEATSIAQSLINLSDEGKEALKDSLKNFQEESLTLTQTQREQNFLEILNEAFQNYGGDTTTTGIILSTYA